MFKKYMLFFSAALLMFSGCEERVFDPVVNPNGGLVLTNPEPGSNFVLMEDQASEVFANFTWTAADFGFDAAVTYTLEIDKAAGDFTGPLTLGITNTLGISDITVEKVNTVLLSNDFPAGVASEVQVRVVATVSSNVAPIISDVVKINVTPYDVVIDYPRLQVPGSYQGWAPEDSTTVIYSLRSDGIYEGFLWISGENQMYKFTDGPSWDTNWGDDNNDGTLEPNGADIPLVEEGYYRFNVNINELTHSSVKTDWGLIGDATPGGWDSDQDMAYDPDKGTWSITLDLVAGNIKFRANDDWAVNFGDNGPNFILEYDGENIVIAEAGNYTVELILNQARYSYSVTKN
jgi:hypothetical protein